MVTRPIMVKSYSFTRPSRKTFRYCPLCMCMYFHIKNYKYNAIIYIIVYPSNFNWLWPRVEKIHCSCILPLFLFFSSLVLLFYWFAIMYYAIPYTPWTVPIKMASYGFFTGIMKATLAPIAFVRTKKRATLNKMVINITYNRSTGCKDSTVYSWSGWTIKSKSCLCS